MNNYHNYLYQSLSMEKQSGYLQYQLTTQQNKLCHDIAQKIIRIRDIPSTIEQKDIPQRHINLGYLGKKTPEEFDQIQQKLENIQEKNNQVLFNTLNIRTSSNPQDGRCINTMPQNSNQFSTIYDTLGIPEREQPHNQTGEFQTHINLLKNIQRDELLKIPYYHNIYKPEIMLQIDNISLIQDQKTIYTKDLISH